ncbi:MAG: ABC transporter ATP-binding protein [Desulfuromonadaceae bacterium]
MSHHIVEVIDLKYSYPDGTSALQGMSFRIHHGEAVAIVGANGAGKSTLLRHLNGYLTPTAGSNLGLGAEEVEARVTQALDQVEASHLRERPSYKLSSGEKRAVAIATVLSMSPDILVMDEPTTGLDPHARRCLINLLQGFRHTKIIATHDLDLVLDLCERTIIIHDGRVTADGATREIFADENLLRQSHLEKPLRLQNCPLCNRPKAQHV